MGKLLKFLDNNIVKIGTAFLLAFIALYPKLPSVHIIRTYVYVRLEDFFIAAVVIIWIIQLIRKKVSLPAFILSLPIYIYWVVGFFCLVFSLLIFGPESLNFFPHIAILEYLRRIEYMILFFVAFSTIKSKKDIRDYFIVIVSTIVAFSLYGIGQKFYEILWFYFPALKNTNFCFPSFQTGNEEFAKGFKLCLPPDGRITSTFGGSYDLSAYTVFVIPILVTVLITLKKWKQRIGLGTVAILALMMLIFTASRVSFISYLIGITATLIFFKRKLFLIPVILISIFMLFLFSSSTIKRFEQTIRFTSVVTNEQGEVVGEVSSTTTNGKVIKGNIPSQALPEGSVVIGLPTKRFATSSATIQQGLTAQEARALRLQNGGYQLSNVKGSFLIQKALTLDISFTTRFQAEWPRAWAAFLKDPWLGTGFSTLTLATDGDYLRFLGESGILGLISFFSVFLIFGIALTEVRKSVTLPFHKALFIGAAGGLVGLFVNAIFIDIFEASKIAESLWIILGVVVGGLYLYKKEKIQYLQKVKAVFISQPLIVSYLFLIVLFVFIPSISNFFVADDFTWLHWVANITFSDVAKFFTDSSNFFYRPFDKTAIFLLYTLFSFNPQGFHLFIFMLHFLCGAAVYLIAKKIFKNRLYAFAAGVVFLLLPSQSENVFWISTISTTLATLFMLYGTLCMFKYTENKSIFAYIVAFLLGICAMFSYEMFVMYPLLMVLVYLYYKKQKFLWSELLWFVPFFLLIPIYYFIRHLAHAFSGGGDYSYSLIHFVPNFFGNIIGYFGLFVFGESFISLNSILRTEFKSQIVLAMFAIALIILMFGYLLIFQKKLVNKSLQNNFSKTIIFLVLFIIIGLLPFIGLGNIAERYGYFSSAGYTMLVILLITKVFSSIFKNKNYTYTGVIIAVVCLCTAYFVALQNAEKEWTYASSITKDTMADFRLDYQYLNSADTVYLVNLPIKYKNAWVFPLGVNEAMWFIYRDNKPKFVAAGSINQAKIMANYDYNTKVSHKYIFSFDKNEYIYTVK